MFKVKEVNHAVFVLVEARKEHVGLLVEGDEAVDLQDVLEVFLGDFLVAFQVEKLESLL